MPKTYESQDPRILVEDVHKDFTLRHTHSFKETFVAAVRRKPRASKFHALKGVDFAIGAGESVALLGFNGSGKSTMLKLVSGVLNPDSGRVRTRGRVAGLIEVGAGFHPDLSGRENIYLNAAILGMSKAETEARFDDIVAFSEIEQFIDTEVKHYSSGMFLRLAFSVAIHTEVDVLLIDEILSVGDEPFQRKCLARIRQLHDQGKTLVIVSHDLDMVSRLCERGIVLKDGLIAFDGPASEAVSTLRRMSVSPFADVARSHPMFDTILTFADSGILPTHTGESDRPEFRPHAPTSGAEVRAVLESVASPRPQRDGTSSLDLRDALEADLGAEPADGAVSRAEFAGMLHRLAGSPSVITSGPFTDVTSGDPVFAATNWMFAADIARGWEEADGSRTYRPDVPLTREALVTMVARYRDLPSSGIN